MVSGDPDDCEEDKHMMLMIVSGGSGGDSEMVSGDADNYEEDKHMMVMMVVVRGDPDDCEEDKHMMLMMVMVGWSVVTLAIMKKINMFMINCFYYD